MCAKTRGVKLKRLAEMGRKRGEMMIAEKMLDASRLIAKGATRSEAAKAVGLPERSFYRYYGEWMETNLPKLRDVFKRRIHQILLCQDLLYRKAIDQGNYREARRINLETVKIMKEIGFWPKQEGDSLIAQIKNEQPNLSQLIEAQKATGLKQ